MLVALVMATLLVAEAPRPAAVKTEAGNSISYIAAADDGMTLYVFDGDRLPAYACSEECLQAWPPLRAGPGDQAVGDWAPVSRPSGLQWAYKGRPVYRFARDQARGAASGDGLRGWHALEYEGVRPDLALPPAASLQRRLGRFILADHNGKTLYSFARDGRAPACVGECLEVWPPLHAAELSQPIGDWRPVDRPDGVRQWSFQGKLVYTFSADQAPGEARGADAGGLWHVVAAPANRAAPSEHTNLRSSRQ